MTRDQAENWQQFAQRMAWESNRWRTKRRRNRVVEEVRHLVDLFLHNYEPHMTGDWDGNQVGGQGGEWGERYGRPHLDIAYPGDEFDRMMEDAGYVHFWEDANGATGERETDFASSVICSIRAGFDVAVHPSAGVVGSRYTVGMLRRMFPEGLPAYVDEFFHGTRTKPETPHLSTLPDSMQVWL